MATKLCLKELVNFKQLLTANLIQVDAAVQLLIKKGFFSEQELFIKLKQVQAQYREGIMIKKIVPGGQSGADRAALDFAIKNGTLHGGWIPKSRLTEEGPLSDHYYLQEMPTDSYPALTEQNKGFVLDFTRTFLRKYDFGIRKKSYMILMC